MSTLLEEIKSQIISLKTDVAQSNIGTVREISDGVAKIEGLSGAALTRCSNFPKVSWASPLTSKKPKSAPSSSAPLKESREGDQVRTTGKLLQVPVGKGLLGRVVDALGKPIDGKGDIKAETFYPVEKSRPALSPAKSVSQPIQTGSPPSTP